jgi:hypothetical protein
MAADRPSGGYQDHPGYAADAGRVRPSGAADIPALSGHPAETRERGVYYQTLRTAAEQRLTGQRLTGQGRTEPRPEGRRPPDSIRLPPERARHILDGDSWGGGHRHGTGRPGKAEFPARWDDERTIGYIMDVARHPDTRPVWQPNHRWRLQGERDAVAVTVIVKPDGGIWAAWPEEGSPGVTRNPSGGQS